jgi:ATP-dependent protease ClpP protease subunit
MNTILGKLIGAAAISTLSVLSTSAQADYKEYAECYASRTKNKQATDCCEAYLSGTTTTCSYSKSSQQSSQQSSQNKRKSSDNYEIVSDIQVDGLRVKLVRIRADICKTKYYHHLELDGPIGPDSTFVVTKLDQKVAHCFDTQGRKYPRRVYLNSNGGLIEHGFRLGEFLRSSGAQTYIKKGDVCASACAVAFLGGKSRKLESGGKIVFHAPYSVTGAIDPTSILRGQVQPEIDCRKNFASRHKLRGYYKQMLNVADGERLFDRTMSRCSITDGWTIADSETAKLYGIAN